MYAVPHRKKQVTQLERRFSKTPIEFGSQIKRLTKLMRNR
jgi:hypothetical protein